MYIARALSALFKNPSRVINCVNRYFRCFLHSKRNNYELRYVVEEHTPERDAFKLIRSKLKPIDRAPISLFNEENRGYPFRILCFIILRMTFEINRLKMPSAVCSCSNGHLHEFNRRGYIVKSYFEFRLQIGVRIFAESNSSLIIFA